MAKTIFPSQAIALRKGISGIGFKSKIDVAEDNQHTNQAPPWQKRNPK